MKRLFERINFGIVAIILAVVTVVFGVIFGVSSSKKNIENLINNYKKDLYKSKTQIEIIKNSYEEDLGIISSYYSGYDYDAYELEEVHYNSDVGFYSELRDSSGTILAYYRPFIGLRGETTDGIYEHKVILLNEEINIKYENIPGSIIEKDYEDVSEKEYREHWAYYSLEDKLFDGNMDGLSTDETSPITIIGTCDENYIYVEKMTWEDERFGRINIYSPDVDLTHKGTESVKDWINSLKDKKCYVNMSNRPDERWHNTELNAEAKVMCKEFTEEYLDGSVVTGTMGGNEKTYYIKKIEPVNDDYFVSSVYVFHPLEITGNGLDSVFWGHILCSLGLVTGALCIHIYKKLKKDEEEQTQKENLQTEG